MPLIVRPARSNVFTRVNNGDRYHRGRGRRSICSSSRAATGRVPKIILIERGTEPSFANCGLPYYVGGVINSRDKLLIAPVERLRQRYRLDVRTLQEDTAINREQKSVAVKNLETGETYEETYDRLIVSTGASPFRPPVSGIDSPNILQLRDLTDADRMHELVTTGNSRRAVIVGTRANSAKPLE